MAEGRGTAKCLILPCLVESDISSLGNWLREDLNRSSLFWLSAWSPEDTVAWLLDCAAKFERGAVRARKN